jgi:hypothetical protein
MVGQAVQLVGVTAQPEHVRAFRADRPRPVLLQQWSAAVDPVSNIDPA